MERIRGYIERIVYRNNENGYTVLRLEENGLETTCVGVFRFIDEGEYFELTGEMDVHPVYGEQFRVQSAEPVIPTGITAIERYLGSGAIKGIGQVTAKRIVEKFGEDALRVIDEEPERLAEIKGISMKKAQEICAQQEEKKDLRNALIFLGQYGISNALAVRIYSQYGRDVYSIIRENPYRLADDITGIGFRKADEIAFSTGIAPNSDFRIKCCIIHLLVKAAGEGNVYLPEEELVRQVFETLQPMTVDGICDIENADVERCIMDLAIDLRLIIKEHDDGRQVYYASYYYTEYNIAVMLHRLNLKGRIREEELEERISGIEKETGLVLDELQRQAVMSAACSGVLIMTGGPGTGKTTTINAIIRYFEQEQKRILLAAPTGRAAKRMTEASGREASTIHRMLELAGEIEDTSAGARFDRNEDNPLDADVIIIDEVSMVDIFLMASLLKAIRQGTRLILVGDANQLPSVGAGNVLKDLIDSECFNTVKLNRVFRQAEESDIIVNAHKINKGEQIKLEPGSRDFIFIKRDNPNIILGSLLTLVRDKLPGYVDAPIRDIQVLAPAKKGPLGVEQINMFLQSSLNPPDPSVKELPVRDMIFRKGDKVMHIKNDYTLEWEMRTRSGFVYDRGAGIFNGDIGIIEEINEQTQMLSVQFDDGKHVIYNFEKLDELTLSYASTIHKAQGSEYPAVVIPLLLGPPMLMNRNILYTAVTRARKCVCIVGSEETVRRMIENISETKRYSGLTDRVLETKTIARMMYY